MEYLSLSLNYAIKGPADKVLKDLIFQARQFKFENHYFEAKTLLGMAYGVLKGSLRQKAKLELAALERDFGDYTEYCQLRQEIISQCIWVIDAAESGAIAKLPEDEYNRYLETLEAAKALMPKSGDMYK